MTLDRGVSIDYTEGLFIIQFDVNAFSTPGQGKTMLMCGIIGTVKRENASLTLLSYFCRQTSERNNNNNNATALLRGIIHHLLEQHPLLIRHVRTEYDSVSGTVSRGVNAWIALSKILNILGDPSLPP